MPVFSNMPVFGQGLRDRRKLVCQAYVFRMQMINRLKLCLGLLVLAFGLSACGVRGGLEAPPEDRAAQKAAKPEPGQPAPHKPFILDGLIR